MGYLDFLDTDEGRRINKAARESCTYNAAYAFWREQLFERIMRLFIWENTYDESTNTGIKPKEIESRLLLSGHCGIADYKGELTAFYGSFYGVTKYLDEWSHYTVRCPIYSSSQYVINKNIIVIDNNSLRNPSYALVHHYATMLAHTDVTLMHALINARDSGGVPVATTKKQKDSIEEYQARIFNGQYGVVTDIGNIGLQYAGADRHTNQDIIDIIEVREKLIKSFYSDIGVRSAFEKRNNTVMAEVEADTSLLLLNIADMRRRRENGCEAVNKMFGTSWSVRVADEISYGDENERVAFDTNTVTHVKERDSDAMGYSR